MMIFGNDLPFTDMQMDPREALKDAIALSVDDWSESRSMAWVYGIVLGWDNDEPDDPEDFGAMDEIAEKFGWTPNQVERLRELHRRFNA
jgi:hypothetical protein